MQFDIHYSKSDLQRLFADGYRLLEGFYFGAATAGYQIEGGYNGPAEPRTNWHDWEQKKRVEKTGNACRAFEYYEQDAETMKAMNFNMYRMSVEWARVQPSFSSDENTFTPPEFNEGALLQYARLISAMMDRGLEPLITLHHFIHPAWAGIDFWLNRHLVKRLFGAYVDRTVRTLNELLIERFGKRPIRFWITLNEINLLAAGFYTPGSRFPHKARRCFPRTLEAYNNMFYAHVLAYDAIHRIYREKGWDRPMVSTNTCSNRMYTIDKFFIDLLLAREHGLEKRDVESHLFACSEHWDRAMDQIPVPVDAVRLGRHKVRFEDYVYRKTREKMPFSAYGRLLDDIYASEDPCKLDYLSFDFYDIYPRHQFRLPERDRIFVNGTFNLVADPWNWVIYPQGLYHYMRALQYRTLDKPMLIAENGMSYKFKEGRCYPRPDGATRDQFLKATFYELLRAMRDGAPCIGYLHWSLLDNYEWGSYQPHFGLLHVDFERNAERSPLDAAGVNAAGAYAGLIEALRGGESGEIEKAFMERKYPEIPVRFPG